MSDDLKARLRAAIDDCGWDGIDETVVEEAIARIATLETAIRMRVDRFKCPIHGNAHCPEDYMLDPDGEPMHPYDTSLGGWRNGEARCGQRPTIDTILTDE